MDNREIETILQKIGERVPAGSTLTLVGGSALALLGNLRSTIDIDFVGDDIRPSELHQSILKMAEELGIYADPVPLERFIPLPDGSNERRIHIGQFGNLEIYVADPYSIALSKIDRGADTDYDDLLFLIKNGYVELGELESILQAALPRAREFDFEPDILEHWQEIQNRLR
ncbi:MAG: hypothetical protein HN922_01250 [Anaerolineae bacterium]|jgi:hypothetical protein|nr:hypothetical protein [Anaerolineae bacterium]